MNQNNECWKTPDIGVSAYLVVTGHTLIAVEPIPQSRRCMFVFGPDAKEAAASYFTDGQVGALRIVEAMRQLKSRIRYDT